MAQITLNLKSNSESFATNDEDILYVSNLYDNTGAIVGSILTIIDTASAVTTTIDVEENITAIKLLTTALVQITTTQNESPLICISRIKDIYTYGSVANIRYDDNGNVFSVIKTTMTTAQILAAIQVQVVSGGDLEAVLSRGNETGNNDIRFTNGGANILSDGTLSIAPDLNLLLAPTENLTLQSGTETLTIFPVHTKFAGLVSYADNAAALTAGLVAGDTYILDATKALTVVV